MGDQSKLATFDFKKVLDLGAWVIENMRRKDTRVDNEGKIISKPPFFILKRGFNHEFLEQLDRPLSNRKPNLPTGGVDVREGGGNVRDELR